MTGGGASHNIREGFRMYIGPMRHEINAGADSQTPQTTSRNEGKVHLLPPHGKSIRRSGKYLLHLVKSEEAYYVLLAMKF